MSLLNAEWSTQMQRSSVVMHRVNGSGENQPVMEYTASNLRSLLSSETIHGMLAAMNVSDPTQVTSDTVSLRSPLNRMPLGSHHVSLPNVLGRASSSHSLTGRNTLATADALAHVAHHSVR